MIASSVGMVVWLVAFGLFARFDGTGWSCGDMVTRRRLVCDVDVVGVQQLPISSPTGAPLVDGEALGANSAILAAQRSHGLIAA